MRVAWLYIVATVMLWPVGFRVASVGGKPIDLILSDGLPLLIPLTYFFSRSKPSAAQLRSLKGSVRAYMPTPTLTLIFVIYGMALAGIGVGLSGETVRLFSAFKLVKPIAFVFLGMMIGSWSDPFEFIDITSRAYGVLVGLTMICTVTGPEFPMGDWGKYIFEWEIGGYPNSSMSFFAALVPLLLASVDGSKYPMARPVGWGLAGCSALMILGSMSRSSALALICGVVYYLARTGRIPFLVTSLAIISILSIVGFGVFSVLKETEVVTVLLDRVQTRLDRSTESDDPSSGRYNIWSLAIELWTEKPVLGYMFESFSRYAEVDTPHQQYLEVLHKCGGLGLLVYMSLLITCLMLVSHLLRMTDKKAPARYCLHAMSAMLIGVMIGNLTQPNLTFSQTGNLVFLLFGCLCSSRAAMVASQPIVTPRVNIVHRYARPRKRFAA